MKFELNQYRNVRADDVQVRELSVFFIKGKPIIIVINISKQTKKKI